MFFRGHINDPQGVPPSLQCYLIPLPDNTESEHTESPAYSFDSAPAAIRAFTKGFVHSHAPGRAE